MVPRVEELTELGARASAQAVELALTVLAQDVADAAWAAQLGPALAQATVAQVLGKSEQAVSKDRRLLRIRNRDGRPVYPVFQFDGRAQLPGIAEVVAVLTPVLLPLTVASWLTSAAPALERQTPLEALRSGQQDRVLAAARRLGASAA